MNNKLLIVLLFLYSCNSEKTKNVNFNKIQQVYNPLQVRETGFFYKKSKIFKMNTSSRYPSFTIDNFFCFKGDTLCYFLLISGCCKEYLSGKYEIGNIGDFKELNECNISITPILSFGLVEKDTLYYMSDLTKEYWITLSEKFYDVHLQDTLYRFTRLWKDKPYCVIVASRSKGIVGLYNLEFLPKSDRVIISDTIGYTALQRLNSNYTISNEITPGKSYNSSVNLELIKEFTKK